MLFHVFSAYLSEKTGVSLFVGLHECEARRNRFPVQMNMNVKSVITETDYKAFTQNYQMRLLTFF